MDGRGCGKELGGVQGGETIISIHYVRKKTLFSIMGKYIWGWNTKFIHGGGAVFKYAFIKQFTVSITWSHSDAYCKSLSHIKLISTSQNKGGIETWKHEEFFLSCEHRPTGALVCLFTWKNRDLVIFLSQSYATCLSQVPFLDAF